VKQGTKQQSPRLAGRGLGKGFAQTAKGDAFQTLFAASVNLDMGRERRSFALGVPKRGTMHSNPQQLWLAWAEGKIDDATAQAAAEAAHKPLHGGKGWGTARPHAAPTANARSLRGITKRQRSPDRQRSLERRRRLAGCGMLPPPIAAVLTQGERSVLTIVAFECRRRGDCRLPMDAIAAMAGVSIRLAQYALRHAEGLRIINRQERRLSAFRNDTNVIRVTSPEWRAWLKLHRPQAQGANFCTARPTSFLGEQKNARPVPQPERRDAARRYRDGPIR
jgi:hypothetical protein